MEAKTIRQIYTGDNLAAMQRMRDESVDLIYLDPPFNSNRDYAAPITVNTSQFAGHMAKFVDTWEFTDADAEWLYVIQDSEPFLYNVIKTAMDSYSYRMGGYLCMMVPRLLEMKRLMKPTASIYLHCDPTASHYLKVVMDTIFGKSNFRNEIVWGYNKPRPASKKFVANHDIILFYGKSGKGTFNPQRVPTMDGKFVMRKPFKRPDGTVWKPKAPGKLAGSWWYDIASFATRMSAAEKIGYPTQKPLKLLERVINASSNPGDLILDPFAGCATACVAAEKLGRQWIGIDVSDMAAKLVIERLQYEYNAGELPAFNDREIPVSFHPDMVETISVSALAKIPHYRERRPELYIHQDGECAGCKEKLPERLLAVDHVKPRSKGGSDELANLQLLCSYCNSVKGRGSMDSLRSKLRERGIID